MDFASPQFWVAVLQIIAIDIVLGGDNAVVIALACRRLAGEAAESRDFLGSIRRDCSAGLAGIFCPQSAGDSIPENCSRVVAIMDRNQAASA